MSIIEKVKDLLGRHSDKLEQGIDKTGEIINDKTGGKYSDQVQSAQEKAKDALGQEPGPGDRPGQPPQA